MAHIRLEAVLDPDTTLYAVEVYYPAEATEPYVRSRARFATEAEAFSFAKEMFGAALEQPVQEMKPN